MSVAHRALEVLDERALNRALLARQHLLRRGAISPIAALEHLVGLQAQAPAPPYVGLWTRLEHFQGSDLSGLIETGRAVRIALMRSTIHLVSAEDAVRIRPTVQPVLDRGLAGSSGRSLTGVKLEEVADAGRSLLAARPLTFSELGKLLAPAWPGVNPAALANVVRTRLALVQPPPRGLWGRSGPPVHQVLEASAGAIGAPPLSREDLIRRYLGAFGPATLRDMQVWSGLTRLGEVVERLRPELLTFRNGAGAELFDLPEAPRPDRDHPAPVRFLPEFDNVLLSHHDRTRVVADQFRSRLVLGGMVRGTVLVDGFVRGVWRIARSRRAARLLIEPLERMSKSIARGVTEEGARLLGFAAGDLPDHDVALQSLAGRAGDTPPAGV